MSDFVRHLNLSSDIFLSSQLSSRVFSRLFCQAVFVITTQAKETNVSSMSHPLLEIKTINKNKKRRPYQAIKTSGVGFWSHKQRKRTRNKIFIKSQKIPILNFIALNQAKEQGTCLIKAQKLAVFVFEVRNKVKETETKFSLIHGNYCCFSFLSLE